MILIGPRQLLEQIGDAGTVAAFDVAQLAGRGGEIAARLRAGEHMVFAGTEGMEWLERFWIRAMPPRIADCWPDACSEMRLPEPSRRVSCRTLYCMPPHTHIQHGVHEEPRACILPLLQASDAYGRALGAPAVLVRHDRGALTTGDFERGHWYVFAFDSPLAAYDADRWRAIVEGAAREESRLCRLVDLRTQYAMVEPGEPVLVTGEACNRSDGICALRIAFTVVDEAGLPLLDAGSVPLALNPHETLGFCRTIYPDLPEGCYSIQARLLRADRCLYGQAQRDALEPSDGMTTLFCIFENKAATPVTGVDGAALHVGGERGFHIGTHLYPTSSFYELSYRPLPLREARDAIGLMARQGIRLCRIWADPVLDEESLRAMAALVRLMAREGIAAIVTVFTSWVEFVEVNTARLRCRVRVQGQRDEALIGLALEDVPGQCAYATTLAEHLKGYANLIWDITNEFSVVDPDENTVDGARFAREMALPAGVERNIALFRAWAGCIRAAIGVAGAFQPVIDGCSCWDTGAENYRCTRDADIVADHLYLGADGLAERVALQDASSSGRPFLAEEFGGLWGTQERIAAEYLYRYHVFFAAGHAAAVNYEWGVVALCRRMPTESAHMRALCSRSKEAYEGFVFGGRYDYAASWEEGSLGVCPWAASFEYGVNAPCSMGETPAMLVMRRMARFGRDLPRMPRIQSTALVLPFEVEPYRRFAGYTRKVSAINRALDGLWGMGAEFMIIQEDALSNLPDDVKLIVYPSEDPVKPEIAGALGALEPRGVRVYRGVDDRWSADQALARVPFVSSGACRLQVRDVPDGRLLALFPQGEGPCAVELPGCGLALDVDAHALVLERQGKADAAEVCGRFTLNGDLLCETSMRCMAYALYGDFGRGLALEPFGPGEVLLYGRYAGAYILTEEGRRDLPLRKDAEGFSLAISRDEACQTIHVE